MLSSAGFLRTRPSSQGRLARRSPNRHLLNRSAAFLLAFTQPFTPPALPTLAGAFPSYFKDLQRGRWYIPRLGRG